MLADLIVPHEVRVLAKNFGAKFVPLCAPVPGGGCNIPAHNDGSPCPRAGKRPAVPSLDQATGDLGHLAAWLEHGFNLGLILDGFAVLDIDFRRRPTDPPVPDALDVADALSDTLGADEAAADAIACAWAITSARGVKLVFKARGLQGQVDLSARGVRVRVGDREAHEVLLKAGPRQIAVLPPSLHPWGGHAEWDFTLADLDDPHLPDLPRSLARLLATDADIPKVVPLRPVPPPAEKVAKLPEESRRLLAEGTRPGDGRYEGDRSRAVARVVVDAALAGLSQEEALALVADPSSPLSTRVRDKGLKHAAQDVVRIYEKVAEGRLGQRRVPGSTVDADLLELPPAPPVPMDVLPPLLKGFVENVADATGMDPALAVGAGLAAVAAAGRGFRLVTELGQQPALVWVALVAPPGAGKSVALRLAFEPLRALDAEQRRAWEQAVAEWRARGREGPQPVFRPLLVTSPTLEALVAEAAASGGITLVQDELAAFIGALGRYDPRGRVQAERSFLNELWAASGAYIPRRTSPSAFVPPGTPVSVVGGVQPDLLAGLARAEYDDGFLARWLWVVVAPAPEVSTRRAPDLRDWRARLADLARMADGVVEACLSADALAVLQEADERFREEARRRAGVAAGFHRHAPTHLRRLALVAMLARIAGQGTGSFTVVEEDARAAAALCEFFAAHFDRALALASRSRDEAQMHALVEHVKRLGEASFRDLARYGPVRGDDLARALQRAVEQGLLVVEERPNLRGRPSRIVRPAG